MRFADKVVVISGASRGIGRESALLFGREGARVVVNYKKNQEAAEAVVAAVKAAGGDGIAVQADMEDQAQIAALFQRTREAYGRVDVLVANAAATAFKPLLDIKAHNLDRTFRLTVHGFLFLVQQAVAMMPPGGRIIAVSGWDSIRFMRGHGVLGAAKAAVESMTRYLAVELGPKGINVTGVSPGPVVTDSFHTYAKDDWDWYEKTWLSYTPSGRWAQPLEVAEIIAFLASPASSLITGQTIVCDGGVSLSVHPLP